MKRLQTRNNGAIAAMVCLTLALAGCSDSAGGPASAIVTAGVARVDVAPPSVSLTVGETMQLSATAYDDAGQPLQGRQFTWTTSNAAVATTTGGGLVSAVAPGAVTITASTAGHDGQGSVVVSQPAPAGPVIDVSPGVTYQTMTGWEGNAYIGQGACDALPYYRDEVIERAANELGLNRVRLEVPSGVENPDDWWAPVVNGTNTVNLDALPRFAIINDNNDPFTINPAGFHFSFVDFKVDIVVNPLRQKLAARGEHLFVNLTYTDFAKTAFEHTSNPDEYGELILYTFQHLQSKYGWVPDAVEIMLEPDNQSNWTPANIGRVMVAAGDRLAAAGFHPAFIAPSNANATRAVEYFDSMLLVPRVTQYVTDFSYHRYSGATTATLQAIADRTASAGVRSQMLEHIGSGYEDLHEDIKLAKASAWEQYSIAACSTTDKGGLYFMVDDADPTHPVVSLGSRTKFLRQYFLFIRYGAIRLGASSADARFDPLAFRNTDGGFVVVVKASAGGSFQVRQLPAGRYGRKYTTAAEYNVDLPDVTIAAGASVAASIPAAGVITIYHR
jgi:Bacterial Ig-like domain (group 2)